MKKKPLWFLFGLFSVLTYGCSTSSAPTPTPILTSSPMAIVIPSLIHTVPSSPTTTPTILPFPTYTASPDPTSPPTPTPTSTPPPTPTPTWEPIGIELPAPLYFLPLGYLVDDQAVWRLDSGATTAERITPPGVKVTSFDVWPGDGRIAYGTETGELYVVMPGQEPRLFHEAGSWRGRPFVIKSTAWSPNGARLAYSVDHATPDFIDHPDYANPTGLWLLALEGETRAQLLRNGYLTYDAEDVSDLRVISDVIWSPDGHALILETRHWEWHDVFLFFPVASSLDEANLHDPEGLAWKYGGWMRDSQSFLLSGTAYSHWCDLALVRRETRAYETLIVGTSENMCVEHAQELPSGIVFVAQCWSCEPRGVRFYIGHQTEEGFSYKQIGPAGGLCSPTDIKWDETGNLATLLCGRSIPLVSLDSGEIVRIDPIAFLGPLADLDYTDVKVAWGMAGE